MTETSLQGFHTSEHLLEMESFAKSHLKQYIFHVKKQKVSLPFNLS